MTDLGKGQNNCVKMGTLLQDRLWRKNRSKIPGTFCKGVDLNRNYDFHFGGKYWTYFF